MKWIKFKTTKGNSLTVKEDDIALILIDLSTGEGTLRLVNSCFTYDIIDNGVTEFLCGMSVARPLPDWDPEILRKEIQDLKLENDRLQKQNDILIKYVRSAACDECAKCDFRTSNPGGPLCAYLRGAEGSNIIRELAKKTLNKLEEL